MPRPLLLAAVLGSALAVALLAPASGRAPEPPPLDPSGFHAGMLHGTVTTTAGEVHEGYLRWGGDEEALWSQHFHGARRANPWAERVPEGRLPTERLGLELLGLTLFARDVPLSTARPFQARYGEIAEIRAEGRSLRVTLRGGPVVELDRWEADDFADGLRIWRPDGRVVDLHERDVRSVEFHPGPPAADPAPLPLHGTITTAAGDFTGPLQWNREAGLTTDRLPDGTVLGELVELEPIDAHRATATLLNGERTVIRADGVGGLATRGIYVDDRRFGQLLAPWAEVRRLRFTPGGPGPSRDAFAEPRPLHGSVRTTDGRVVVGRIVFDLDETLTTETLDAPAGGIDYLIPFGWVASIAVPEDSGAPIAVALHNGEQLELARRGDLGELNLGTLVFESTDEDPVYIPWAEVRSIEFGDPLSDRR